MDNAVEQVEPIFGHLFSSQLTLKRGEAAAVRDSGDDETGFGCYHEAEEH